MGRKAVLLLLTLQSCWTRRARAVCSARQRYDIIFIPCLLFRINSVFPHPFLLSLLQMRCCRRFVSDAHVQPSVVVEVDVAFYHPAGMLKGVEALLPVDTFHLYYTVGTLCDGIVRRLVVLAHGYGDSMRLEHGHIGIAAILHAAVGVVDKSIEGSAARHGRCLIDGHPQRLHGDGSLECPGQSPAYNHVRVGIGDQVQVAHVAVCKGDVGYVSHPQPVGCGRNKPLNKVLPLVVAVVGVRRVAGLRLGEHQTLAAQQHEETVTPRHEVAPEHRYEHQPQLVAPGAGILRADFPDSIDDLTLTSHLILNVGLRLVEGLTAMAKQPDDEGDLQAAPADQFRRYLAPDFFLIDMSKYSSALSIIMSRARVSRRENSNAFSSSRLRFLNAAISCL